MFTLATMSDLIQIKPQDLGKRHDEALEDNINRKYSNKVLQQVGLCICFWDMLKIGDGLISQGDGLVNVNVKFRILVFRPFKGEIITGTILDSSSPDGIRIGVDFFSDIWIPADQLFEGSTCEIRDNQLVWIWTTEDGIECFYDVNEPVRLRVEREIWHDLTPQKPNFTGAATQNGDDAEAVVKPVCYTIIGSMAQTGLGPFLWWQEVEEEGGVDEGGEGGGEAMET
ncbi:gb [Venturia nashicola]|uniref:DNA-directed RNA polymerase subunit n=1 Tax=Venturia nashicola TaxID=86259 RepID=A0A4Z1P5M6_9PEZI|nr:gb [Venturia nashicola]TLD26025.1 gb [Venturia nashicola]